MKKEARKLEKENKLKKEKQVEKDQKCNRANKKLSLPSSETGLGNLWAEISPPKGRGRRRKRKREKKVAEGHFFFSFSFSSSSPLWVPKKKIPHCVQLPMKLPPAPPEEGTSREKKLQKNKEQKKIFFLHTAS